MLSLLVFAQCSARFPDRCHVTLETSWNAVSTAYQVDVKSANGFKEACWSTLFEKYETIATQGGKQGYTFDLYFVKL